MLVARGMIRFDRLLEHAITIVDVGGARAPAGMRELQQFFGQVLFQKLVRAIFSRRVDQGTPPVTILADEFQELVQPDIANDFERVLALARSQRCFLWASFQQAAQVEAVSPVLMRVLRTNTNTQVMFRSSLEDARPLAHIMPVTGQLRRDADGFPDPRNPLPLVPVEEERRMLLERVPSAPDRVFWLWLRREQHPAILATSPVLRLEGMRQRAQSLDPAVCALVARGVLASSPEQIQQAQLDRAQRLEALAGRQAEAAPHNDESRIGDVEPAVEPPPVEARASAPPVTSAPHRREARPSARRRGRGRGGPRLG
jgi:hypothetical protein